MILQSTDVSFSYADRPALRGVSLSLQSGEIVALIGPNGSGKSTLIKTLLGHLPGQGQILWQDKNLRDWRLRDLARVVAYLPQSPRHDPGQTVADCLRLGRAARWGPFGLESSADQRVTLEVARLLALDDILDRPLDAMSGGQRQRVFIGRCLAQEPAALLLDEPNTFLDLKHQIELWQLLRDLARKKGLAVLVASHELNVAGAMTDRLILLSDGRIAASGIPDAVLRPEVLSPVYGIPIQRYGDPANPVVVPQI
ncbi:MAG: ABC transporter ATP-binding protein [Tepidisphaeraceae bacterium]|jgi:ABC-type cobalamin/Fe3+-siderophores transport system ATPase subunit